MENYYFIKACKTLMGITHSTAFSRDKTRWIMFTPNEKERLEMMDKPLWKNGTFINVKKF